MKKDGRKRLSAAERDQYLHLQVALSALKDTSAMAQRIKRIPRARSMLACAIGLIEGVSSRILDTVPLEQLLSLKRNMPHLRWDVRITSASSKDFSTDGVWVSFNGLDALCDAAREKCLMCMLDKQQRRKCPLAKALDELPIERAGDSRDDCNYSLDF